MSGATDTRRAASAASAGGKRPQREPRMVTSLMTAGARSRRCSAATVVFKTTVPRGRTRASARARPSGAPLASTTRSAPGGGGRDRDQLRERTVRTQDAEHPAPRAMAAEPRAAAPTDAAPEIDLADDPPADQRRIIGREHVPDPLVARRTAETEVAARDLEVGAADAGQVDADERLARARPRVRSVARERQPGSVPAQRPHGDALLSHAAVERARRLVGDRFRAVGR